MSKPKRLLPADEAWRVLAQCDWGTLACVLPDGTPYATPVNAVLDVDEATGARSLVFHCQRHGVRAEALRAKPSVCYTCAHEISLPEGRFTTWYESAQAFGHASFVEDEAEKRRALTLICERLLPGQLAKRPSVVDKFLPAVAIVRIDIERVSAKRNHDE